MSFTWVILISQKLKTQGIHQSIIPNRWRAQALELRMNQNLMISDIKESEEGLAAVNQLERERLAPVHEQILC
jgi:hypothetical protein